METIIFAGMLTLHNFYGAGVNRTPYFRPFPRNSNLKNCNMNIVERNNSGFAQNIDKMRATYVEHSYSLWTKFIRLIAAISMAIIYRPTGPEN